VNAIKLVYSTNSGLKARPPAQKIDQTQNRRFPRLTRM